MRVLVLGTGSIGRRHIQCLAEMGIEEIHICEPVAACRELACRNFKIEKAFSDLHYALKQSYDAAIVCVPSYLHADTAIPVIEKRIPVLIEKPVEINIQSAQKIQDAAKQYSVMCQVAYCLRFNPALTDIRNILLSGVLGDVYSADVSVGQYLPDWRPGVDYRENYSAKRKFGGGVCIDISHEVDYFRWLFGDASDVLAVSKKVSRLEIDVEDIAKAIIVTNSGIIGSIHLDYLSRKPRRQLNIVAEKGNIEYDFLKGDLRMYQAGNDFRQLKSYDTERNLMFRRQLDHFFNCIRTADTPIVDVDDAIKTLRLALKIRGDE